MLMDPWATRAVPVLLPEGAHKAAPRLAPSLRPDDPVILGSLAAFVHAPFDWQGCGAAARGGQSRVRALEEGVVVEVDVEAFTSGEW
jgi:isoamylase